MRKEGKYSLGIIDKSIAKKYQYTVVICKIKILSCKRNELKNLLKTNQTNVTPHNFFNMATSISQPQLAQIKT